MRSGKEVLTVFTGHFFHFTGLIIKVIMAPGSLCFACAFYQLATLQQPDIAGFHIALDLRCINILTVLRYLDIALSMKITADSIIFGMFTGQTNRQPLLLFCIQLFAMRYRCIRFINSYRAQHAFAVAVAELFRINRQAHSKCQSCSYKSLMHIKNSFFYIDEEKIS